MTDIELVIKIPEEAYKQIMEFGFLEHTHGKICYKAIKSGTPLPKGHRTENDKVTRSNKDNYSYSVGYEEGYHDGKDGCGYAPRF